MSRSLFIFEADGPTFTARQMEIRAAAEAERKAREAWEYGPDDSAAEIAAEMANERFFESRGYEEARAQEAWEMSRGITQYI